MNCCNASHTHGGARKHDHGVGTMVVECDPSKLHHHHDTVCIVGAEWQIEQLQEIAEAAEEYRQSCGCGPAVAHAARDGLFLALAGWRGLE